MGKIKNNIIAATIAIAGGLSANNMIQNLNSENEDITSTAQLPQKKISNSGPAPKITKRAPQKVYHNFAEIPAISDEEASLYQKSEYTYVINATTYQKNGQLELKRVLTAEIPHLNILSPIYYRECYSYTPKPNEDPKVIYDLNPKLISPNGTFKGPTQMDDNAVSNFMKYLLANPSTRKYLVSLCQTSDRSSIHVAAKNLEKLFFTSGGKPLSLTECNTILANKVYTNIKIKGNITEAYKKLTASMPRKTFLSELEKYQLRFFGIGRVGKPQEIIETVAKKLNYCTPSGNPNATRVSLSIMGAAYCHVNWKGNGRAPLSDAKNKRNPNTLETAKSWVNGKGTDGVIALAEQNIITPQIIQQYQQMGISGADELNHSYQQAIMYHEKKILLAQQKRKIQNKKALDNKTLLLKNYIDRNRRS